MFRKCGLCDLVHTPQVVHQGPHRPDPSRSVAGENRKVVVNRPTWFMCDGHKSLIDFQVNK